MSAVWAMVLFVSMAGLLRSEGFLFSSSEPEVPIKLYRGNATSGVVLVYINDVWGTVCDDMWDDEDARVVCRQLGLAGGTHVNRSPERFGIKIYTDHDLRTKRILLTDVRCQGTESSLLDCLYYNETISCDHDEDAGVICRSPTELQPTVQTKMAATDDVASRDREASHPADSSHVTSGVGRHLVSPLVYVILLLYRVTV